MHSQQAGGLIAYDGNQTAELVVDGDLIGKHPGMVDAFMAAFLNAIEAARSEPVLA